MCGLTRVANEAFSRQRLSHATYLRIIGTYINLTDFLMPPQPGEGKRQAEVDHADKIHNPSQTMWSCSEKHLNYFT